LINVSSKEVPNANVLKVAKRAEVMFELETSREIDLQQLHETLNRSLLQFVLPTPPSVIFKVVRLLDTSQVGVGALIRLKRFNSNIRIKQNSEYDKISVCAQKSHRKGWVRDNLVKQLILTLEIVSIA
jgi:hypothetical protein